MSEDDSLWALVARCVRGGLVTVKRDGRPQVSVVGYVYDAAGRTARISVTATRAKTRNLQRDPSASLFVAEPDLGGYAVAEGTAELGPVATRPDDAATNSLVEHYRASRGEHPDWDEFRAAMVGEQRLLLRLPLVRVYGWADGD